MDDFARTVRNALTIIAIEQSIAQLELEDRARVMEFHAMLKRSIAADPPLGFALALCGAEIAAGFDGDGVPLQAAGDPSKD